MIIPPRRATTARATSEEKIAKLLYGKTTLSDEDRVAMEDLLKEGPLPPHLRAQFWNVCTGIKAYNDYYCNNYYETMQIALEFQKLERYPNPYFDLLKKDLNRTNQEDPFYTDEVKKSLERILAAYIWRNPTVGYI